MDLSTVLKELGRIKHNCGNITFKECVTGNCPYHGHKLEVPDTEYDDDTGEKITCTHGCLFQDMGMESPYEWEIPEEI